MPLVDIHLHTSRYSACSRLDPRDLVAAALRRGLDGVIITEHGMVWPPVEIEELNRHAAGRLLVMSGQEVRCRGPWPGAGDLLVFGSLREFPPRASAEEIIAAAHDDGGVVVAAHPFRPGLGLGDQVFNLSLDGLETMSGNAGAAADEEARRACLALGLPALGGSDAHDAGQVGAFATLFEEEVAEIGDIVRLIRAGRCRPHETAAGPPGGPPGGPP